MAAVCAVVVAGSIVLVNHRDATYHKLEVMADCMMAGIAVINEKVFYCSAYTPGPSIPQLERPSPPRKDKDT
jgi:hypothetical protein